MLRRTSYPIYFCIVFAEREKLSAEATPKAIMRTMNVKGLTLYHLKSHLQVSFHITIIILYFIIYLAAEVELFFSFLFLFWL